MATKGVRGQELADELLAMSDRLEGEFRREFLRAMSVATTSKALKKLLRDIEAGRFAEGDPIDSRLNQVTISTAKMDEIARKAMGGSARITQRVVGVQGAFNVTNPEVINVARNLSVQLSTNLNSTTQETIRAIIQDAVEGNIGRSEAARKIRRYIGLIPKHAIAVDRYLDRMLQDGVKQSVAKKRADKYAERLLNYRANTIARTEIARSVGAGQTEYWKQMRSEGYLPPEARRVWMTAQDEKVCPICGPMDGVLADVDGFWNTSAGPSEYPQASHPNCRCTAGITMVTPKKKKIAKSGDELLGDWLSKYNPYHDARGRFTSASRAVAGAPTALSAKYRRRTKNAMLGVSSKEREAQLDALVENGSTQLLGKRDPRTGIAQPLLSREANKRYGTTVASVVQYAKKELGVKVVVDAKEWDTPVGVAQMHGTVQAAEEARRMGVPMKGLTLKFSTERSSSDGAYESYEGNQSSGEIIIYRRTPAEIGYTTLKVNTKSGSANQEFVSEYGLHGARATADARVDAARKFAYGISIHEIGHHFTVHHEPFLRLKTTRLTRTSPLEYGRSEYREYAAEAFTAWWLLSGAKAPQTKRYYEGWREGVRRILNIEDYQTDRHPRAELLKMNAKMRRGDIRISDLPPKHPLIVYLTNGASITA